MPLPEPTSNEDREQFVERCIQNSIIKKEFNNNEQRIAVCENLYDRLK